MLPHVSIAEDLQTEEKLTEQLYPVPERLTVKLVNRPWSGTHYSAGSKCRMIALTYDSAGAFGRHALDAKIGSYVPTELWVVYPPEMDENAHSERGAR